MEIRLIMTSVGGLVAPNMIKNLKDDNDFFIVGVDMNEDAIGFHFADKGYVVPCGNSDEYIKEMLTIAKNEKIDIILPLSDEEALNLSKNKEIFEKEGIIIPCSDYGIMNIASNKVSMLQFLEKNNILVPNYRVPHNINELKKHIKELGYPQKSVVFKPCFSRGARGFWIVKDNMNKFDNILYNRDRQEITLEWLLESLNDEKFPEVLVMEYLAGVDFNVDVLAFNGNSLYIIPNQRLVPNAGPVQVGLIKEDNKVKKMVSNIIKSFGFDYWVNVELAYNEDGNPLVYEINPRISAPILATKASGIDLLKLGIKMALDEKIETNLKFKKTKMMRYWNEFFIRSD